MRNYICNNYEYFYGNGYITVSVYINKLPNTLNVNGEALHKKSSFHISLVCIKDIISKYGADTEQKVINFFCDFILKNKIAFSGYKNEFRYVIDKERSIKTMIVMCDVSNINKFFEELNKKFGFDIETPPTHITLYTLQQDKGIGLNNSSDIENKTSIITEQVPPEIKNITIKTTNI